MPQTKPFLSVRSLSHTYHTNSGETPALRDIHFDLFPGEFAAIVGPSGCGKSTLLELIAGLIPIETGSLLYPACNRTPAIGYMLQKDHLLEHRTIYKNIILGLEIQHRLTEKNLEYVQKLMRQYGIADFASSYPRELSGGMRQRAALIRTLALKPEFLLLDEPFSALDYQTRLDVSDEAALPRCLSRMIYPKPSVSLTVLSFSENVQATFVRLSQLTLKQTKNFLQKKHASTQSFRSILTRYGRS